jgi:hypothetical protein
MFVKSRSSTTAFLHSQDNFSAFPHFPGDFRACDAAIYFDPLAQTWPGHGRNGGHQPDALII